MRKKALTTLQRAMISMTEIDLIKMDISFQIAVAAVDKINNNIVATMSEIRVPLKCNPTLAGSIAFNTDLDLPLILQQYNLRILLQMSIWMMFLNELKTYLISTHQLLFKFIS